MSASQSKTLSATIRPHVEAMFTVASMLAGSQSDPLKAAEVWYVCTGELTDAIDLIRGYHEEAQVRADNNRQDHEASKTPAPVGLFEQP